MNTTHWQLILKKKSSKRQQRNILLIPDFEASKNDIS